MREDIRNIDYIRLGERLRDKRRELGITQEELCAMANLSTTHLSNIENGNTKVSMETAFRIAGALNTSVDYFLYDQYNTV